MLFSDLVGSTAISERLDPEELRDLLNSYRRVCREAVGRYEGHIAQFTGDGVMAYFGYPIAHEDDAVRAARAAMSILEGIKLANQGIGQRLNAELHVRVGLHNGVAVVGDVGPGGEHDRLAVGEAVNLAARIHAFAEVDTVLVSATMGKLIAGHFELEPLGAQTLRGFTRPVELFRVVRPTGARTRFEAAARGHLTPFVGREKPLASLRGVWQTVLEGADRVVVVRGEAGIGKSRLIHRFRQDTRDDEVRVLECFCSPLTQATALAPIIESLNGRIAQRAESDGRPQAKLKALESLLGEHSRFGSEALPLIAALLSISGADEGPIQDMSPIRRRARTLEILRAWMAWSAERLPLALLVEDVHWADPSTLELLDLIANEGSGSRTLLCVTARPEFRDRWAKPRVSTIDLDRLDSEEISTIVTHIAGRTLPPLVAKRIADRSEGVPLFAEEITKAALESGASPQDAGRHDVTLASDEFVVPSTVHGSLEARFDRLGESRNVAQLGAAIGREFGYPLMQAVASMEDERLRAHLDRISRSELVFVHGEPPDSVYTFKHALVQDAIYATLLKSERMRVHERIFSALQKNFPDVVATRPEMAAHHAENAGQRAEAVKLLLEGGAKALGRVAVAEAVKHLARGLDLVSALEEPARTTMEIELQAVMGPAYMATLGWAAPEVEHSSARLRDLATARGDGAKIFQAMWGLWTVYFLRGELDPALDVANHVLEMAAGVGDPMLLIAGHHAVGYTRFYRAEYGEALRHADEGLALFDLEREKRIAAILQLSSSCALSYFRAQGRQILGEKGAFESLERSQELAEELGHAPTKAYLLCQLCYFAHFLGDEERVGATAPSLRSLSLAEGFALWVPLADVFLAWASARKGGDAMAAAKSIEFALTLVHGSRTYLNEPDLASMYAEALLLANQPQEALRVAGEALEITRRGKQRHGEPELLRLQGDAARAIGDGQQAEALYREGVTSARSVGASFLELRCALALARHAGRDAERFEVQRILDGIVEGRDLPDCRRAQAFLEGGG